MFYCYFRCKSTKKLKKFKKYAAFFLNLARIIIFCTFAAFFRGMHVIEYILPVDYMRGSLAPRQVLEYALNNNPAWGAPDGINAALNYNPILIAAKKRSKRYFMVRTKSSVNWKPTTRLTVAAFAGACSMYRAILNDVALADRLRAIKAENEPRKTLREWLMEYLRGMLAEKSQSVTIAGVSDSVTVNNNWKVAGTPTVEIPATIYNKYLNILS